MIEQTTTTNETPSITATGREDVGRVAGRHAVVDDVGVELGQVEARERLDREERHDQDEGAAIRAEVGPQQGDHVAGSWRDEDEPQQAVELGELIGLEDREGPSHRIEPQARELLGERSPGVGQRAIDDASVVGAMVPLDEPVALDPLHEPGRRGRAQVEHLRDPAHRLRPLAKEQEQQAGLPEGEVARRGRGRRRRGVARWIAAARAFAASSSAGSDRRWFSHARIVHDDMNYRRRLTPTWRRRRPCERTSVSS